MGRLGGIHAEGLFGGVPDFVNRMLAPGYSDQTDSLSLKQTAKDIVTLKHFFLSPNLVWFAMALAMHVCCPYDIDAAAGGWAAAWVGKRLALNFGVAVAYYGFWHVSLYRTADSGGASRKYEASSWPTRGNMVHNLWYWSLGVLQWTFWECCMCRVWGRGLVSFAGDAEVLGDPVVLLKNVVVCLVVPVWRDFHFYVAHRFLHVRACYKYVHSLHHRNADPEPFSGMTMHPVEHLYYFSNAFFPTLLMDGLSPLIFLWVFVHLSIAPGAGHSGFEDHFQADQYHYLHHRKFECNYGSPSSAFLDQAFGTFREKLGESKEYSGGADDANTADAFAKKPPKQKDGSDPAAKQQAKAKVWSRNGYLGVPESWTHAAYSCVVTPGLAAVAIDAAVRDGVPEASAVRKALAVSVLPVVAALVLCALSRDALSWRWPFHKESGAFVMFNALAGACCVAPVYMATRLVALA